MQVFPVKYQVFVCASKQVSHSINISPQIHFMPSIFPHFPETINCLQWFCTFICTQNKHCGMTEDILLTTRIQIYTQYMRKVCWVTSIMKCKYWYFTLFSWKRFPIWDMVMDGIVCFFLFPSHRNRNWRNIYWNMYWIQSSYSPVHEVYYSVFNAIINPAYCFTRSIHSKLNRHNSVGTQ